MKAEDCIKIETLDFIVSSLGTWDPDDTHQILVDLISRMQYEIAKTVKE